MQFKLSADDWVLLIALRLSISIACCLGTNSFFGKSYATPKLTFFFFQSTNDLVLGLNLHN